MTSVSRSGEKGHQRSQQKRSQQSIICGFGVVASSLPAVVTATTPRGVHPLLPPTHTQGASRGASSLTRRADQTLCTQEASAAWQMQCLCACWKAAASASLRTLSDQALSRSCRSCVLCRVCHVVDDWLLAGYFYVMLTFVFHNFGVFLRFVGDEVGTILLLECLQA